MAISAARTAQLALDDGSIIGFKDCQAGVKQFTSGHDDHVEPRRNLVTAKNLSNQSFGAISLHRPTEFLGGGDAEPARPATAVQHENGAEPAADAGSARVDFLEFGAPPDPLGRAEACGRRHGSLLGADGQTLAALRAPALEDQTAVLRAHPYQEPVRPLATPLIRLERSLPLHVDSAGDALANEPTMLANAPEECQSRSQCATVRPSHFGREVVVFVAFRDPNPGRPPASGPPDDSMRVWSLPLVFHTCGKTCGNSGESLGKGSRCRR